MDVSQTTVTAGREGRLTACESCPAFRTEATRSCDAFRGFIDIRHLAQLVNVSTRTLRSWVWDPIDPLPGYRVGGKLLFRWVEVEAWIKRHKVVPVEGANIVGELLSNIMED